jgi:hypothetical protein
MQSRRESSLFSASLLPARLRACLAGSCLVAALLCLWLGAGFSLPPAEPASAGSFPAYGRVAGANPLGLKKRLLQATVDSAVVSLAGILPDLPDPALRRAVLAAALDALTFDLGAPVYFTAWEDTRLVHSPLAPDTADLDFSDALDGRGMAFVRALSARRETEGGFLPVLLRRHVFDGKRTGGPTASGSIARTAGSVSPASAADLLLPASPLLREVEEARIVYSRLIPGSVWRISAFMPVPEGFPATAGPEEAGPVWDIPGTADEGLPDDLRLGLTISGLSFLGLAGVLLRAFPL